MKDRNKNIKPNQRAIKLALSKTLNPCSYLLGVSSACWDTQFCSSFFQISLAPSDFPNIKLLLWVSWPALEWQLGDHSWDSIATLLGSLI